MADLIGWCAERARMVLALCLVSLAAGLVSYVSLPKEGEPDIDIPVLYVSVGLPGVSAADSERFLVKPLEQELRGLEGLVEMTAYGAVDHAAVLLEFDFGWDKAATIADVRALVNRAEAEFPDNTEEPTITEVNLSQFPIFVVSLSGEVPERTLLHLAKDLQRDIEGLPAVLEAELSGHREEMIEVLVDPLKLESYDITAEALLETVARNNRLVAADSVESGTASFQVNVPGAFERPQDVTDLPIKVSGDRVVRLSDLAEIRRTFEDPVGRARLNGERSVSLQVSKRIGENIIATVATVRALVDESTGKWPEPLQRAVRVDFSMDQSASVEDMVGQLENSVITAMIMVMIVVLAALGFRSALLVGIAIPGSFLLSFGLMAALGMSVNNMTMFGLILAVGMLVDGAIVVVEHADKLIKRGEGPMRAYTAAARRMFWPIASSTATTLCAFLPMLLWPGMPGEFMGQLPVTLIFVLSGSLIVALIYLPVIGGVLGRVTRALRPTAVASQVEPPRKGRTPFGRFVALAVMNPIGPLVALGLAITAMVGVLQYYGENNNGVEFFVETDPDRAIVHVRARGNLSLAQADRLVRMAEERIAGIDGIVAVFATAGSGGVDLGAVGDAPSDSVGTLLIELAPWSERGPGQAILDEVTRRIGTLPGAYTELIKQEDGPQQGKPIQLLVAGDNWPALKEAAIIARAKFEAMPGLVQIDDTLPLPGIEWRLTVDREAAGRYGADIATIGPMVQLVTRGVLLDTMGVEGADEKIDIRARLPEPYRHLSTLETLRVSTNRGLVPLENFVTREAAPKLEVINRRDTERFYLVRADVDAETSDIATIEALERWIEEERPFPEGIRAQFTGDREEQEESMAFLGKAFAGALGLMFVILLAQFNSLYNALLVLSAVVLSVAGVLVGMLVMGQKFSIIMTGTGIVALAGIVVNNNIVLIDTFQDYARRMNRLEAIVKTAEDRIRPVLLTTITTIAGLLPMMLATSFDFGTGTLATGAPTALWWVQLATAVVFGLGTATVLTLLVTPAALALREWVTLGAYRGGRWVFEILRATVSPAARLRPYWRDRREHRALARQPLPEIQWEHPAPRPEPIANPAQSIRAAE
ncbi:MAG: efflux RND transporter permease subunit [Pseudomonadota bacterium]